MRSPVPGTAPLAEPLAVPPAALRAALLAPPAPLPGSRSDVAGIAPGI